MSLLSRESAAPAVLLATWREGWRVQMEREPIHRKRTFQEELVLFLKKYGVEYNEGYIWD